MIKTLPHSLLLLNANGVDNINSDKHRLLLTGTSKPQSERNTKVDNAVNLFMRCAVSLSDEDKVLVPLINGKTQESTIPLIADFSGKRDKTDTVNLLYYNERDQIFLKMRLHKFNNDSFIDEREVRSSALFPIKFFYRGMNVAGVEKLGKLVYPCWDIEAHAFFGDAENIISISRNHLLPDVEDEVYKKLAESADDALSLLFSWLSKPKLEYDISTNEGDCDNFSLFFRGYGSDNHLYDGLYLSLLYHQISSEHYYTNRHIDYQGLRDRIGEKSRMRILVLKQRQRGYMYAEKALIKNVFENGTHNNWYINPSDVPYTNTPRILLKANDTQNKEIDILIQDIFTGYLLNRNFTPLVNEIWLLARTKPYPLAFIHNIGKYKVSGYKLSDELLKEAIKDMIDAYIPKKVDDDTDVGSIFYGQNEFPLLPALDRYPLLTVSRVPMEIPQNLKSIGRYFIVPYTLDNLREIKEKGKDKIPKSRGGRRKWVNDCLKVDQDNDDIPFQRLVRYAVNEISERWNDITEERVINLYIDAAVKILDMLIEIYG